MSLCLAHSLGRRFLFPVGSPLGRGTHLELGVCSQMEKSRRGFLCKRRAREKEIDESNVTYVGTAAGYVLSYCPLLCSSSSP